MAAAVPLPPARVLFEPSWTAVPGRLADRAEQELKRQYINKSLYGAEVVTTVTPIERNRVNLAKLAARSHAIA